MVKNNTTAVHRLTALWALSESGLGGLLHAFKMPFTGLLVGGIAMIIIALICHFSEKNWNTIISSLFVVLLIKFTVSPHSSLTAYVAVAFQGLTGALLYSTIRSFSVASILFMVLGQLESSMQKLLMLTFFYGNSLWTSIDTFGKWISRQLSFLTDIISAQNVILLYVGTHALAGVLIAIFTIRLKKKLSVDAINIEAISFSEKPTFEKPTKPKSKKKKKNKKWILFGVILLFVFSTMYFLGLNEKWNILYVLVRTIFVLFIWFIIIGPLLKKWLEKYLKKHESKYLNDINSVFDIFPYLKFIVIKAREESVELSFPKNISRFLYLIIAHSLLFKIEDTE